MTVQGCYAQIGGDCAAAMETLESEARVRRYLLRFARDPTPRMLLTALQEQRWQEAFRTAHALKGVCRGLGLTRLYAASAALTETLRAGNTPQAEQIAQLRAAYEAALRAIRLL